MDIGVLLIVGVAFFFLLACFLVLIVMLLKTKETTDTVAAEVRAIRKELERMRPA